MKQNRQQRRGDGERGIKTTVEANTKAIEQALLDARENGYGYMMINRHAQISRITIEQIAKVGLKAVKQKDQPIQAPPPDDPK